MASCSYGTYSAKPEALKSRPTFPLFCGLREMCKRCSSARDS